MRKIKNITLFGLLIFSTFNCGNNSVGPVEDTPGRRDYTWTVDTVNSDPYKTLSRLWGGFFKRHFSF